VLCLVCGSDYPRVWPDEVLFFSPSYELYKYNILRTPVLEGLIPGMSTHTLWMPPAFFYLQAIVFQFLPDSIEVVRLSSAFIAIVSIFIFSEIAREMGISRGYRILLKILILSDFLFFKIAHSARMESLCTLFAFLSMFFLVYKRSEGRGVSRLRSILSGCFLGLSFLAHPFAISYAPVLLAILFFRKELNLKNLVLLTMGGSLAISPWLIYVLQNWEIFTIQFGAQLGRKKELFGIFTIIYKFKIIFSEFRFPTFKVTLFLFTLSVVAYKIFRNGLTTELKKNAFPVFLFSITYLSFIILFLFISSESWYVYHFIFPLSLLLVSFSTERSENYGDATWILSISYNTIIYIIFFYFNFYLLDMKALTQTYHRQIEAILGNSRSIYLQSIPDSYFYLRSKHPEIKIYEFIPGELPIPQEYYSKTITSIDAYVFYRKELMNPILLEYFSENIDDFKIEEIEISTPPRADINLKATVYVRR
jgi:hypothetical protein